MCQTVVRYRIICDHSLDAFKVQMQWVLYEGWQPQGGLVVQTCEDPDGERVFWWAQAMVKYADEI